MSLQGRCRLRRASELLSERGEWNEALFHQYFAYPDVEEILKIRPCWRLQDDVVLAWAPDMRGVFSVRSAYRLAIEVKLRTSSCAASRAPDGNRAIWKAVWRCPAPPKVSHGCGSSGYSVHPELWIPVAAQPRVMDVERMVILMTFWRAWHCQNEVTHHKPAPTIESSRQFLSSYIESLICMKQNPNADFSKGKMVVDVVSKATMLSTVARKVGEQVEEPWCLAPSGWAKLNVEGAFKQEESWLCSERTSLSSSSLTVSRVCKPCWNLRRKGQRWRS
ncbi:uncharacterized protein [Triticum aestivum]|uniref:uncharacterized protein n=1 Tax=Triticum aestivum TaxID=4565 RepID=UPI001D018E78|nr:uncharacterized protein LOC123161867 [Triticum aestivum]